MRSENLPIDRWLYSALVALTVLAPSVAGQDRPSRVLSLEQAMNQALANSQVIEAQEEVYRNADQQVREAWARALPDVRANAQYQRNLKVQEAFLPAVIFDPNAGPDDLVPVRFGSDNTWSAGIDFSQALFEMDVFVGLGAAGRYRNLQGEALRGTAQSVVTSVRIAYLNALLAREQVRLTTKSVERVRSTLEETRALNRAGLASDYDVLRLEVQLANVEPQLDRARNSLLAAKRTLSVEMGSEPNSDFELEGQLNAVTIDSMQANAAPEMALINAVGLSPREGANYEQLIQTARTERSEIRQLRLGIELEEARARGERAQFFPKLSVFGNLGVQAQENGAPNFFGGPNERTTSLATGVRIEVPIFTGFSRPARVAQANANVRQNEAQLDRQLRQVQNELQTAIETLNEAERRVRSQRTAVAQANRGFEIASAEYREGVGSQLQITDAELALRESEFNYAQAVYDYLTARARLDAAAGLVPDGTGSSTRDDTFSN